MRGENFSKSIFFNVFLLSSLINLLLLISTAQSAPNATLEVKSLLDILRSPAVLMQILAGSAVVTAVINVIWFIMSGTLRRLQHWWNTKSIVYPIEFQRGINKTNYEEIIKFIDGFYCLVVRHGSDQYISTLASDQEKYEGRLKNKILPIRVSFDKSGNAILTLTLPVHKRMGTQFKCFVDLKDTNSVGQAQELFDNCDRIGEVSISKSVRSNRIYFLLDRFAEVTTIDFLKNNIIFPE